MEKEYWVYILHCANNTYYTGYTVDVALRYQAHLAGKCKYTRSFKPLKIAQRWRVLGDKSQAMYVERYIKKLARCDKIKIINEPNYLIKLLAPEIIMTTL